LWLSLLPLGFVRFVRLKSATRSGPAACPPAEAPCHVHNHRPNLSTRTRLLNAGRSLLMLAPLESELARQCREAPDTGSLLWKLVPNNYQYPAGSARDFQCNGLNWRVDVSDYIGHCAFFGLDRSMKALFELARPDSVVLDIGVNLGWTALNLGKLCSRGQVFGFEPDPENFDRFMVNMHLNQLPNVSVSPVALCAGAGKVSMHVPTPSNRGGNRIANATQEAAALDIPMMTADEFVAQHSLARVDLVKIDTEGYELQVLRGASGLLTRFRPVLFVEINDDNLRQQGGSANELFGYLKTHGYTHFSDAATRSVLSPDDSFVGRHFDVIAS